MKSEIYDPVVAELCTEVEAALQAVPDSLTQNFGKEGGLATGALLSGGGWLVGSHLGIAGFFGAISGALPLMLGLGAIGLLVGNKVGEKIEKGGSEDPDPCSD